MLRRNSTHRPKLLDQLWTRWQQQPHTRRAAAYSALMLGGQWGLVPALLHRGEHLPPTNPLQQIAGTLLITTGVAWTAWSTATLTQRSVGTPFPFDPPRRLVTSGPFQRTRNPMMLGVLLVIAGNAVRRGSRREAWYGGAVALAYQLLVRYEEEPWLRRHFGSDWEHYAQSVPRWLGRP